MTKPYFSHIPDFLYVDRAPGQKTINDYAQVKNLFKRAKLREDIYSDLAYFTKYKIVGNERPDNVAEKVYDDTTLDWVILISNNIINVQTEWPMSENSYRNFLIDKYGDDETIGKINHYECTGVKTSKGVTIIPEGMTVDETFSINYLDPNPNVGIVTASGISKSISNLDYENKIQDAKRNIFVLKPRYLNTIFNDLEKIMEYKKGSTQFLSETLVKGESIRLYS